MIAVGGCTTAVGCASGSEVVLSARARHSGGCLGSNGVLQILLSFP